MFYSLLLVCMSGISLNIYSLRNVPGTLDPAFGGSGTGLTFIDLGGSDRVRTLVRDAQGRIVAGGEGGAGTDALIVRFTPNGIVDTTFGGNGTGFTLIDLGGADNILTIALDTQGRIIAGGRGGPGSDAVIMRFNANGTLDTTFGGSGTGFRLIDFGGADRINSLVLDDQDRIIAVGRGGTDGVIMRFTPEGFLDLPFGGSGTGFNLIDFGGADNILSLFSTAQGGVVAGGQARGTTDVVLLGLSNQLLSNLATALREKYCFTNP